MIWPSSWGFIRIWIESTFNCLLRIKIKSGIVFLFAKTTPWIISIVFFSTFELRLHSDMDVANGPSFATVNEGPLPVMRCWWQIWLCVIFGNIWRNLLCCYCLGGDTNKKRSAPRFDNFENTSAYPVLLPKYYINYFSVPFKDIS